MGASVRNTSPPTRSQSIHSERVKSILAARLPISLGVFHSSADITSQLEDFPVGKFWKELLPRVRSSIVH